MVGLVFFHFLAVEEYGQVLHLPSLWLLEMANVTLQAAPNIHVLGNGAKCVIEDHWCCALQIPCM